MVNTLFRAAPGSASIDIREAGRITAISIQARDVFEGAVEVSFLSTASTETNDTTGVIGALLLNGSGTAVTNSFLMDEPVEVGERIFLHVVGAGNVARCLIYTTAPGARPATRRR